MFSVSLSLGLPNLKLDAMASNTYAKNVSPPHDAIVTEATFVVSAPSPAKVLCAVLISSLGLPMVGSGSFSVLSAVPFIRQNQVLSTAVLR